MRKIRTLFLSLFAASMFVACNNDDAVLEEQPVADFQFRTSFKALKEAKLLLRSIWRDGGTPYNVRRPALRFTSDQNVFLPSVLGIDYRIDRSVVPAGPTARFPMFKGWETTANGKRECYYVITEASDKKMAKKLGVIFSPRSEERL